jgi:hypothetical protein
MIRLLAGGFTAAALLAAPVAGADPEILLPGCSSGQNPEAGACAANPLEGFFGDAAGASPNVPLGLTPQLPPMVAPLGLTPGNLPATLGLGVTPPNIVSGR